MERYRAKFKVDARAHLSAVVRASSGKDGLIVLEADDEDPKFAADLANAHVEELRKLLGTLAVTEAQQRRLFFEKQLKLAKDNLTQADLALRATGVSESVLKSNPASAVAAVAGLRAQLTAQEVKIGAMRGYLAETAPEFKQALNELANLRAQIALVDPLLTHSMPPSMTANTGVDALAQAIAATVAIVRTPIGDAIAFEAIRMMTPALVAAYKDGNDHAARAAMSCGSMMAGLSMNISDCTAEHSLGQAIGGVKHVPHGMTIGLVVAETLERERQFVPEQLERVADAMGEPDDGSGDGSRAVRAVKKVLAALNFPVLSDLEFSEGDLDGLAELALADYFITMSPQTWTKEEVIGAFRSALALTSR